MASFVKSKRLLQRKKPNTSSTWSSSSTTLTLQGDFESTQQLQPFDATSTQERIRSYELKYQRCMASNTSLSTWIKSVQNKGLPTPLLEGSFIPPPSTKSTTKSRLPDVFSSLSTRPNTAMATTNKRMSSVEPIITKSSLSTFLKKATDSLSLPKRQQKPARQQLEQQQQQQQQRFSLTSSLNRFSLPKNSSYISMTEKYHSVNSVSTSNKGGVKQRNRFSSPPPLPNPHHHHYQNQRKQQYNISPPELIKSSNINLADLAPNKKSSRRPQSTILPHSPSSIFLDRLRMRNINGTCHDVIEEKELVIQQHSSKQDICFPHIYTIVDNYVEDITPPSSPSSTDSTTTPPSLITSTTITTHSVNTQQKEFIAPIKKKRTSLLVSPSLSTIRLISQKSQFLKRSSMMSS